jgi:hypothetical protein
VEGSYAAPEFEEWPVVGYDEVRLVPVVQVLRLPVLGSRSRRPMVCGSSSSLVVGLGCGRLVVEVVGPRDPKH